METFAFFVLITMAKLQTALYTTSTGCADTCVARSNGNYQHCCDCHYYVACSNGYKDIMPCPSNLVWDDVMKRCEWMSLTCNARMYSGIILPPRHACCTFMTICKSIRSSQIVQTRVEMYREDRNCFAAQNKIEKVTRSTGCVNSCVGQLDGNYQHCSDCHQCVTCSNWYDYTMPCPSNLVWDDIKKR